MRIVVSALLLSVAALAASAFAEPARQPQDIIDSAAVGGICMGGAEECANGAEARPRPGFDMLVNFELDSAELTPGARTTLAQFARALRENRLKAYNFVVEGHADLSGPAGHNAELSRRRAEAVARFLLENGVEPARISTAGMGTGSPRVGDPYDPVNRRVEVRVVP